VYEKVQQLSSASSKCVANLSYWLRFALDDSVYQEAGVPVKSTIERSTRYSEAEVEKLLAMGHIELVQPSDVRGEVLCFTVNETAKKRRRRISHTRTINQFISRKTFSPLFPVKISTKSDVISSVHSGDFMISLDFAGWFDQLPLSDRVSRRMCFKAGNRLFRLKNVPMGMSSSVGLACAVTDRLLDFEQMSRSVLKCIDNVLFIGTREAVLRDAALFRQRCVEVGAVLNEADIPLEYLLTQKGEWCGVVLDLVAKTVQLTQKCVERTRLSWALREQWTWRGFQSCVGMLFWSYGLAANLDVHRKFALLRYISRVSADLQERPELIDAPARIWPSALRDMQEWVSRIEANAPRSVPLSGSDYDWLIATDASKLGWGYFAFNVKSGQTSSYGSKWSSTQRARFGETLSQSTTAEPIAVVNSLCHWYRPASFPDQTASTSKPRVHVLCDNIATVCSFSRGFSTSSLLINQQYGRMMDRFPFLSITISHLQGAINPADGPSRGVPLPPSSHGQAASTLLQVVGPQLSSLA